jgi:DNA-binding Lrp family transcriptional regulator
VLECYQLAGNWDNVLRVVARDLDEFREFCVNSLSKMIGVGNVKLNIIIIIEQVNYSTGLHLNR